jgi:CMP/dCMP kinase
VIITIDGPAGSGKSSVASELARQIKFLHLNSGILYRAVGYIAKIKDISYDNHVVMGEVVDGLKFDFILNVVDFRTDIRVLYAPDNLSLDPKVLLLDEYSQGASKVGTISYVREVLTKVQREIGAKNNLVLEGRDSGSIVFPQSDFKFYLDAPLEERVKRRIVQEHGASCDFDPEAKEKILREIRKRDERDSSRSIAPHIIPKDAFVIDTQSLSLQQVVEVVRKKIGLD